MGDRIQEEFFSPVIRAVILRINPRDWHGSTNIRFELYGCPSGKPVFPWRDDSVEGFPLGMETWDIMDGQIAARASYSEKAPWFARRNFYDTLPNEQPYYTFYDTETFWQVS